MSLHAGAPPVPKTYQASLLTRPRVSRIFDDTRENVQLIEDSIIWGDTFEDGIVLVRNATVDVSYSDVSKFEGVWEGTGNIKADPIFTEPDSNDYSLQEGSPAIDAGNPNSSLDPDSTRADMGAIFFWNQPEMPTLIGPKDVVVNLTPTLVWLSSHGATSYRLQVSTDTLFATPAFDDSSLTSTEKQVGPLEYSTTYYWRVKAANQVKVSAWSDTLSFTTTTVVSVEQGGNELPREFSLEQNYPNPFNPTTTIKYALPKASHVTIKVYNTLGAEVATLLDDRQSAGEYQIEWNAKDIASGLYVYRIKAGNFIQAKTLVLLK